MPTDNYSGALSLRDGDLDDFFDLAADGGRSPLRHLAVQLVHLQQFTQFVLECLLVAVGEQLEKVCGVLTAQLQRPDAGPSADAVRNDRGGNAL
jgi:hypothetical protein